MITRSELCGKPARTPDRRTPSPWLWDIALGLGAVAYVLLALFDGLYSPFMTIVVVAMVAYGLVRPHRRKRQQG